MTFSVEHNFDETVITLMDNAAELEDVKIYFTDDGVDLLQVVHRENLEVFNGITLSHEMLQDLLVAYQSPEGLYSRT